MAAVNLSSLSQMWSSIKSFLSSNFYDETVLWNDPSLNLSGSTSVNLSETLNNFARFRIEFEVSSGGLRVKEFERAANTNQNLKLQIARGGVQSDSTTLYAENRCTQMLIAAEGTSITLLSSAYDVYFLSTSKITTQQIGAFKMVKVVGIGRL